MINEVVNSVTTEKAISNFINHDCFFKYAVREDRCIGVIWSSE